MMMCKKYFQILLFLVLIVISAKSTIVFANEEYHYLGYSTELESMFDMVVSPTQLQTQIGFCMAFDEETCLDMNPKQVLTALNDRIYYFYNEKYPLTINAQVKKINNNLECTIDKKQTTVFAYNFVELDSYKGNQLLIYKELSEKGVSDFKYKMLAKNACLSINKPVFGPNLKVG